MINDNNSTEIINTQNEDELLVYSNGKDKKYKVTNNETRENIIAALQSGTLSRRMAAKTFNVNYNTICCIYRKYCLEGHTHKKRGADVNLKN